MDEISEKLSKRLNLKRAKFSPVGSLENRQNCKRLFKIYHDGSIEERVSLDVPEPSHREFLICMHYMRNKSYLFHDEEIGISLIGRDDPWDFRLGLSTGEEFNLEVTAIADSDEHFKMMKREERLRTWGLDQFIPLHELRKLNSFFPDVEIQKIIDGHLSEGKTSQDSVANPLLRSDQRILLGNVQLPELSLGNQIRKVVGKKCEKHHRDKDETVLIVDNRTSAFDMEDYESAADSLHTEFHDLPFPEIWFYTGYFSDDDGNNAEFSFAPLKLSDDQWAVMNRISDSQEADQNGRYVW